MRMLALFLLPLSVDAFAGPLTLSVSDMVAGERTTFTVEGADPGRTVYFGRASTLGTGPCPPLLNGVCLDLVAPSLMGAIAADATGSASLTIRLPPNLPVGAAQSFQAAQGGPNAAVSNPFTGMVSPDADGDGYGDRAFGGSDCDDTDAAIHPDTQWYLDVDLDGFGSSPAGSPTCVAPASSVLLDGDCDDGDAGRFPDAAEIRGDAIDQDCDGLDPIGVVSAETSNQTTCVITTDDTIVCHGPGDARTAAPAGSFTDLSCSDLLCCAVDDATNLQCWGLDIATRLRPADAPAGPGWSEVDLRFSFGCSLDTLGAPSCWGPGAPATPALSGLHDLVAGDGFACALDANEIPQCWGSQPSGTQPVDRLIAGDAFYCGLVGGVFDCVGAAPSGTPSGTWVDGAAGDGFLCGMRDSGQIQCWGVDNLGQVSQAPTGSFDSISATRQRGCATRDDGTYACWGSYLDGASLSLTETFTQLTGTSGELCGLTPERSIECLFYEPELRAAGPWQQVVIGSEFMCAIDVTDTVHCAGNPNDNVLDLDRTPNVSKIAADGFTMCVLHANGDAECTGRRMPSGPIPGPFVDLEVGSLHACGIREDGTVDCWGTNGQGQSAPPAGVFTDLGASQVFTCGIREDTTADCWGDVFFSVPTGPGWVDVDGTFWSGCFLRDDGEVDCTNGTSPAFDISGAQSIHSLDSDACVLAPDGAVACWGQIHRPLLGAHPVP